MARLARIEAELERMPERVLETVPALKPLMSVADVARTLGVSARTVETLIGDGQLRPIWIGGQRRFHPDSIHAFIAHRAEAGP